MVETSQPPAPIVNQPLGAMMHTEYVGIRMTIYPIDESRLEQLSATNDQATGMFSAGTGFLSFGAGLLWNVVSSPADSKTQPIAFLFMVFCLGLSVVCFAFGVIARRKKSSILDTIRRSVVARQPGPSQAC